MLLLVVLSMGILALLSAVPWSGITGNTLKDFNLLGDLFPRVTAEEPQPVEINAEQGSDAPEQLPSESAGIPTENDGNLPGEAVADSVVVHDAVDKAPVVDGCVMIESYLPDRAVLPGFRAALAQAGIRPVYVAMLGDSYIEGDIFAQDLRDMLQQDYGGCGVGHVALHCDFPGFRSSVRMSDSGWKLHDIRTMSHRDSIRQLSGDYAVAGVKAKASYKGNAKSQRTAAWERSSFYFLASDSGSVTLTTDGGSSTFAISPSSDVQCLSIPGNTGRFEVETNAPGLCGLGVRLDPSAGVVVDCMSIRGNSGLQLSRLNRRLCDQMAQYADYSLIILEYGMNALNDKESDYTAYGIGIKKAIDRLKSIYPGADILVLGVGDRGVKSGTAIVSLPACRAMVKAQRDAAAKAGVHFWDTRAAMGGEGSIAEWRRRRLVNADYIHVNHDGGRELAALLYKAMKSAANE